MSALASHCPTLSRELRVSTHSEGAVILDIRGGDVFTTNKVGARILTFLDGQRNLADIADEISKEFTAPPERVQVDLANFIKSLKAKGFLHA